ncbi:MAG: 1,6-anhydro-N-acetylmuramyl-L-alanine amidase AmpD [Pseudomonadota bacterium]
MAVEIAAGMISGARRCLSPNCDDRPETPVDMVVVHNISLPPGEFGGPYIEALFTNKLCADEHEYFAGIADLRVSAHLLIRRDGEIVQFVPFDRRAWHAGASQFCGREACNDFSIGIELEGTDHLPYEEIQYQRLAAVVVALIKAYPGIDASRIVGHADIAPDRKTDPGPAFDWSHFLGTLESLQTNA